MSATDIHSGSGATGSTAASAVDVTEAGAGSADVTTAAPDVVQAGPPARGQSRRTGYEHLAPLFVEYAALPEGHPHRERLRNELIAGHLPVARHIAGRFRSRGEPPQDLEQVASLGLILAVDRFEPGRAGRLPVLRRPHHHR